MKAYYSLLDQPWLTAVTLTENPQPAEYDRCCSKHIPCAH